MTAAEFQARYGHMLVRPKSDAEIAAACHRQLVDIVRRLHRELGGDIGGAWPRTWTSLTIGAMWTKEAQ